MLPKLGILAGGGDLPARLIAACRDQGRDYFVLGIEGHGDPKSLPAGTAQAWIRIGEATKGFALLHQNGVAELVMAGAVRRPSLRDLTLDLRTAAFFARVGLRAFGDDGLLRALISELEKDGFRVIAVQDILGTLLAPEGVWGRYLPDVQAQKDIAHGIGVARDLGARDLGQAAVVQQGAVLGVEGSDGTNALIKRCATLRRPGAGPVLVKMAKPQQDRRADLPTIGLATIHACAHAKFAGIAVEAGSALVVDREAVVSAADIAGLFLYGIPAGGK